MAMAMAMAMANISSFGSNDSHLLSERPVL